MQSLEFDFSNTIIYQIVSDLDTPEAEKNGGITFDELVDAIDDKLWDKEPKQRLRRIFDFFIDPNTSTITLRSLKKIAKDLGKNLSDYQLKDMLVKTLKNEVELTFEEFYDLMNENGFP